MVRRKRKLVLKVRHLDSKTIGVVIAHLVGEHEYIVRRLNSLARKYKSEAFEWIDREIDGEVEVNTFILRFSKRHPPVQRLKNAIKRLLGKRYEVKLSR